MRNSFTTWDSNSGWTRCALNPECGILTPTQEPGLGMTLRKADAEKYRQG